jgi:sugar phosphate isomerase/epimerase
MTPVSVQLYSLREESAEDFDAVLTELAQIGFKGVEPFHLFGKSASELRQQVEDLGMRISSSHYPWANRSEPQVVIDTLGALGLDRAVGGFMPDDFKDLAAIEATAETTNVLVETLKAAGIELALHNHWWEFELIDGRPGYHHFQELVPDVLFEIDTYWAANFGKCDPAVEVARVRERTPLLHIKDGPLQRDAANLPLGDGVMDIPDVIAAADPEVMEWLVIEFDKCDTDMMSAVKRSYQYMIENALGVGNV